MGKPVRNSLLFTMTLAAFTAPQAAMGQPAARPRPTPPAATPAPTGAERPAPNAAVEGMTVVAGGITAEQVALRAVGTSYQVRAAELTADVANERAEQAWTNFLPRLGLKASYTRLSNFTPPSLGTGSLVGTAAPPGTINPTPTVSAGGFSFPLVLDQYLTQATIVVPISDYFLRINKAYTAAQQSEEAARFDIVTSRAKSYSDGKIAYFTWLRARGAVGVATQSLAVARAHQRDAENQFAVGNASRADVLRAETTVAAAELAVERAKSAVVVTERQVRIAMHLEEGAKVDPGEALETNAPPALENLKSLVTEAQVGRPEIKSIEKNADAARKLASVARAGRYPVVSGFGDLTYANPNQRRFPQTSDWFATWALGAQVTWSPNDIVAAGPQSSEAEARASALEAQKGAVRDGVELEVTQAYQGLVEANVAASTTTRQLESALEAYRVARELFNNGRATGTSLLDAETALAQTRFEHLNARVDLRLARIRLDHAVGRDAKAVASVPPSSAPVPNP